MKSDATTINYARVFHLLREQGASTRAQLARDTGLSPASITTITRDMIQRGYVREAGAASSDSGRPPIILEYNSRARYALGIDVHADGIFGVVTDLYARPLHSERLELPRPEPEAMIEALGAGSNGPWPPSSPRCAPLSASPCRRWWIRSVVWCSPRPISVSLTCPSPSASRSGRAFCRRSPI